VKVLVIDNYDSFTYNLCHLVALVTGEFPTVIRNDEVDLPALQALAPDAVILSPGPGHPSRERDFGICAQVLEQTNLPVLGVCLGHQGIAHYSGGSVGLAAQPVHGLTSRIRHCSVGLFQDVPQDFAAVRYHSFVVSPPLPPDLEALAWTPEGEIMALRHRSRPFWGVQFHPESVATEHGARLLQNFFREAAGARGPTVRAVDAPFDPEHIYTNLFSRDEHSFWLDSATGGQYTYIGGSSVPGSYLLSYSAGQASAPTLFDQLRARLGDFARSPKSFGFSGGFVGYLGFELKEDCGYSRLHKSRLPDAQLLFVPGLMVFDHLQRSTHLVFTNDSPELHAWAHSIEAHLHNLAPLGFSNVRVPNFSPRLTSDQYLDRVSAALDQIRQGESYEICLTDILTGDPISDPLSYYCRIRQKNPAPYCAFLKFAGVSVASSSPERFLRIEPGGRITSKPIKGTAPRAADHTQDEQNKQALLDSTKDAAEHLMIVDLVRNDLGRVCEPCSVHVPVFRGVESYARVHQLVSTIEGQLRTDCDAVDAIQAAFPAGSMTGAPKARTLEILDQLEVGARGIYSGAIGWLGVDGCCDLNVVIRTAVMTADSTEIGSGGAIVAMSDAGHELEELLLKVAPLTEPD
jgi:para-aminobenzoate synthetase